MNPHEVEKIVLEWLGVVTAVSAALLGTISLLWMRWKSTMKQLLDDQATQVDENAKRRQEMTTNETGKDQNGIK